MTIQETTPGTCRTPKVLRSQMAPALAPHRAHSSHVKTLTRNATVASHIVAIVHTIETTRHRHRHYQRESRDTSTDFQASTAHPPTYTLETLGPIVKTGPHLVKILIKSETFRPLPDRGPIRISHEKDRIDTPQKKATAVLSAKRTRILSDASVTNQRLLLPTGESLVICVQRFPPQLIFSSRRW
jgi:hypothetical protein